MKSFSREKESVFIIAELSANHGGKVGIAKETIRAAKRAGADAIKLQTYTANTITLKSDKADFIVNGGTIWDGRTLHDLYIEGSLPWEWHKELFEVAKEEGLICFSSPFDKTAVDFLEELNTPIYKIASLEITDIPLIRYVASKGKPIILSSGVATYEDLELAVNTCRNEGNDDITILKCTTAYPTLLKESNLKMMKQIAEDFSVKVGLSDHSMGIIVPIVSVGLGASVIEKHFILDKKIGGPDASFSLDEKEFTEMVKAVRAAESSIGQIDYHLTKKQIEGRKYVRSLYVSEDVNQGDIITRNNVRSIRPGFGMHPKNLEDVLGQKFRENVSKGEPLSKDIIDFE